MELMIECIFVPPRPDLDPSKVVTVWDTEMDPQIAFENSDEDEDDGEWTWRAWWEMLNELKEALATEVGVTREFLDEEAIFFRISERTE